MFTKESNHPLPDRKEKRSGAAAGPVLLPATVRAAQGPGIEPPWRLSGGPRTFQPPLRERRVWNLGARRYLFSAALQKVLEPGAKNGRQALTHTRRFRADPTPLRPSINADRQALRETVGKQRRGPAAGALFGLVVLVTGGS